MQPPSYIYDSLYFRDNKRCKYASLANSEIRVAARAGDYLMSTQTGPQDVLSESENAGSEGRSDAANAMALQRALAQLSGICNAAALHANVLAAVRGLTKRNDDLSIAGSDSDLESPVPQDTVLSDDTSQDADDYSPVAETALREHLDPRMVTAKGGHVVADKYYTETSQEEQSAVLSVAPVQAFLSVTGGFTLSKYDTLSKKIWRKVKPQTPEQEARKAKVQAAASIVLKSVLVELRNRWGEAMPEQKSLLGKQIRSGLRHLPEPAAAVTKLVNYLCHLGHDWESMLAASRLSSHNIHEWSNQNWASLVESAKPVCDGSLVSESDSEESVWECVAECETQESQEELKRLMKIQLLRRVVAAHISGKLVRMLTEYRLANPPPKVTYPPLHPPKGVRSPSSWSNTHLPRRGFARSRQASY